MLYKVSLFTEAEIGAEIGLNYDLVGMQFFVYTSTVGDISIQPPREINIHSEILQCVARIYH